MTLNQIKALIKESEDTGRPIQYRNCLGEWYSLNSSTENVSLDAPSNLYRVAPPELPKPREWWVHVGSGPRIRDDHGGEDARWIEAGWIRVREVMEDSK